jgi:hypothetical protein
MHVLLLTLAALAITLGLAGTLMLMVFCVACSPNSSRAQLRQINFWLLASAVVGVTCFIGGCTFAAQGSFALACVVGVFPLLALVSLFIKLETTRNG